jgi:hypothetical protein
MPRLEGSDSGVIRCMRSVLQSFLRWIILGATGIFIIKMLYDHWPEVQALRFQPLAGVFLSFAIAIAIATQLWSGISQFSRNTITDSHQSET